MQVLLAYVRHGACRHFADRDPEKAASFVRHTAVKQIRHSLPWIACRAAYVLTNCTWWRAESSSGANRLLEVVLVEKLEWDLKNTFGPVNA